MTLARSIRSTSGNHGSSLFPRVDRVGRRYQALNSPSPIHTLVSSAYHSATLPTEDHNAATTTYSDRLAVAS